MLYETATAMQQTSFTDAEEASKMAESIQLVIQAFEKHAHTEDTYVFPAIAAFEPAVVAAFEEEHDKDYALGLQLQSWLTAFETAATELAKQTTGERLVRAFTQFMVFNLTHMAEEEDMINKLLWRYYTDVELEQITQLIISNIPPPLMAMYSKWMVRGMNNTEITGWLKEVKNSAPEPVWISLLTLAEQELPAYRWQLVQETLTEGAMVA